MMLRVFVCFIALFSISSARGNDSIASVDTQGIVLEKSEHIRMKKEVLKIRRTLIEVNYEFLNEADKDIETIVAFPIPDFHCGSLYEEDPKQIFTTFKVSVDGKEIKPEMERKAFHKGRDISGELKKLGVSPDCQVSVSSYPKGTQELMKETGFTVADPEDETVQSWTVQTKYFWKMKFPAKKIIKVSHSYEPMLGSDSVGSIDMNVQNLSDDLMEWSNKFRSGGSARGSYILMTGNNWKKGIESFELIVEGDQLIWVHFEGVLNFSIGELKLSKTNYLPTKDLHFAFAAVSKPLPPAAAQEATIHGPANLRLKPAGMIKKSMPDKSKATVMDYEQGWYKVSHLGDVGYTAGQNLHPRVPLVNVKFRRKVAEFLSQRHPIRVLL